MSVFAENVIFRSLYCLLGDSQAICAGSGLSLLPSEFNWFAFALAAFVTGFLIINVVLIGTLGLIWAERRLLARFQNRVGPNRWGPSGILTPVADALKILFKEDIVPQEADHVLFTLAPVVAMASVLIVFGVVPFGSGLFVSDIPVGLIFVLGITSLSALATLTAGWASANRISIFSSLRAIAVLISYEIPLALSLVGVIMLSGSFSLRDIVAAQDLPYIFVQPLGFLVFFAGSLAEINRTPFDITEADSELGAGHLNDYSSMKFGLMYVAEFIATLGSAAVITTLFLGGGRGFGFLPTLVWFAFKMGAVVFVIVWIRASWPRLRVDQILELAWKGLFELTLVNIVATAIMLAIFPQPTINQLLLIGAVNWIVFFVSIWLLGRLFPARKISSTQQASGFQPYPVASTDEGSA